MNNNVFKSGLISILFLISFIVFIIIDKVEFSIISLILCLISLVILIKNVSIVNKPNGLFNEYVKNILETYESILVEIDKFPDIKGKELYRTKTVQDLLNLEVSIKKPIYYATNNESYDFILIDNNKVYINTLKKNKHIISCLDLYLNELNKSSKDSYNLIEDLDKTTIIKVDDNKEFVVYPLNK